MRFYDLRRTFTTLVLEPVVNAKEVVQEILGYASISQTMNTYSHVTPTVQQAAFSRLGERPNEGQRSPLRSETSLARCA